MAEDSLLNNCFIIAFTISMLINLFGNILVCFVVLKFRDMRIPMNYLLVNLAISDMMVGFFMSPRFIFGRMLNHPGGTLGDYFCKILTGDSFTWTGALASDVTLVCIAVERYLSIRFPHSNKKRLTTKKLKIRHTTLLDLFPRGQPTTFFLSQIRQELWKLCAILADAKLHKIPQCH